MFLSYTLILTVHITASDVTIYVTQDTYTVEQLMAYNILSSFYSQNWWKSSFNESL